MKSIPKISVVMSVYNGERYLSEAVDSIRNQTFREFEFIIINDGSTDRTKEILESYNDPRIVLIHQKNIGLTKSLNKGIDMAKGKYIARQDADDISLPKRLEKQFTFLENHENIALLGTAVKIIDENGTYLQAIEFPCDYSSIRKVKRQNPFSHGSVMFKRQYFFELGGYRDFFLTAQDYDLWLRFVEKFEVANLSTPLYKQRFTRLSITFKKIITQTRFRIFARKLARARGRGLSEIPLIKELKNILESPLSFAEKKEITQGYNYWGLLLLHHSKKKEAFLFMDEIFKYHPSSLYKLLFKITKIFHSSFLLEMLIMSWSFFNWLKKREI